MKTIEEKFWRKVAIIPEHPCWEWVGLKHKQGYGRMRIKAEGYKYRKALLSHRVSWEIHNGPIPDKMFVLHKCDNTSCVNPQHLFIGDQFDNMRDMVKKGRWRRGKKRMRHY